MTEDDKELFRSMPELVHHPDKRVKFDWNNSQVIEWITEKFQCTQAESIRYFELARRKKLILFDPVSRAWMGAENMKVLRGGGNGSTP